MTLPLNPSKQPQIRPTGRMANPETLKIIWLTGHTVFLVCSVLSILPFGFDFQSNCNFFGFMGHIAALCVTLFMSFGAPQFSKEYLQKLLQDKTGLSLFYDFFFVTHYPGLANFAPIVFYSVLHTKSFYERPILAKVPESLRASVKGFYEAVERGQKDFMEMSIRMEFFIFPYVIFMSFATGAIWRPIVYLNYIKLRLQTDRDYAVAKAAIGKDLDALTLHPYCPVFIRKGYTFVSKYF